jgi:hypothetical protein
MTSPERTPAPAWLPEILTLNAVASGFTGLLLVVSGEWLSTLMFAGSGTLFGLDLATILRLVGGGLILFAAAVAALGRRPGPAIAGLAVVFIADLGWVLGSLALVFGLPSLWTVFGIAATLVVALAVAFFAWCEGVALSRMNRGGGAPAQGAA